MIEPRPVDQPRHRYIVADLVTDQTLGVLPMQGVSYSRRVSAQGDLSGTFTVATPALAALARVMNDHPVALYAERLLPGQTRGDLWWGGIVWTCVPHRDRRGLTVCELQAATIDSMPGHRTLLTDLSYASSDAGLLFRNIWTALQARSATDQMNVEVGTETVGVNRAPSWLGTDGKKYADLLNDLSTGVFEWTVDVFYDSTGTRHRKLRLGTPTLGQANTPHVLTRPGNLVSWRWPADHTANATHYAVRGTATRQNLGAAVSPVLSMVYPIQTRVDAGEPRVDAVISTDDEDVTIVNTKAAAARDRGAAAQVVPEITVRLGASTFAPGNLGDYARVIIVDPYFPGGKLDTTRRAIGLKVTPAERGRDEETTIEFQGVS